MARVVGRARPTQEGVGASMKLSETGIFIVMGIIAVLALKWYFVDYRHSPGYVLGQFIGAIKAGNIEAQYNLLDDMDKQAVSSESKYEKAFPGARGYTERITGTNFEKPLPDGKDPNYVTINATVSMRGPSGKELTDAGTTVNVTDKYVLHKDSSGNWKIVLSKSDLKNMLKQTPNPPGDSF